MRRKYTFVGLGGTFDHFHAGHEHFLQFAHQLSHHLVIGVTTAKLTREKKFSHQIFTLKQRIHSVVRYCRQHGIPHSIVELSDVYGPTLTDKRIKALVVTELTTAGARTINDVRLAMRFPELPVHVCTMKRDSKGNILSSTSIRSGICDRSGFRFDQLFERTLTLTASQKQQLQLFPHTMVSDFAQLHALKAGEYRYVVGDITYELFHRQQLPFNVAFIDGKSSRQPLATHHLDQTHEQLDNPAGQITSKLCEWILNFKESQQLVVAINGEEDLVALALVMLAPLGSQIFYGAPQQGVARLDVSLKLKQQLRELLEAA